MDYSMGTFIGLGQSLPANQDAPSLLDLTRALVGLQKEVLSLKQGNLELHAELQQYKPQDTPWGRVKLKQRSSVLQAPRFDPSNHVPRPDSGPTTSTTQPMQVMVTTPTPVPLAPPERFFGDSAKFNIFLNQCQLQFLCRAAAFPNDAAKVAFIISYLGGNAANWSIPLVDPILYDFNRFKEALRKLFAKHLFVQASDNELLNLHQENKNLLSYITSFNRLLAETERPEEKRTSLFYHGLQDDLKDVLAQIVQPPTSVPSSFTWWYDWITA
ncbi:hypothetical protein NDU88_005288 [Pleurodeles waltl]|uniref:Retrotransposon gag domain-containing protein n=1 Tax=Pleurodeles waltl TaxID=8319 RepID=A0AAV7M8U9_PLEWA|nr:hypothetical protein NDU88_005288 [Pleurodeles waltl]